MRRLFLIFIALSAIALSAKSEQGCFVKRADGPVGSLSGKVIALWQSHGWYYEQKLDRWEWQRARIFQTVEDLYTQSYVMPFLTPMLENSGAYIISPRERDANPIEIIIDNDGGYAAGQYYEHGHQWTNSPKAGFAYKKHQLEDFDNPFSMGTARTTRCNPDSSHAAKAEWQAAIPRSGDYAVYISYQSLPKSSSNAHYTVHSLRGDTHFIIDQTKGGGTWIYLGHFPFSAGSGNQPIVSLSAYGAKGTVITADAVKIGGGMGNVARRQLTPTAGMEPTESRTSGYPRFTEAARYWLQWAGIPDSVYSSSAGENDYTDDYKCRGLWVNYMAGGSKTLPTQAGLGIPVDMAFAFHSDAGTVMTDSIIGTLGIYCSDKGKRLPDGRPRKIAGRLTDMVMTQIVGDIQATFEPKWTRRHLWDKSYAEARIPQVPTMLLELLSHQNFADMKYGLDPRFRFTVSRAIYKAITRFLADNPSQVTIQPLPIRSFAIRRTNTASEFSLSWLPTPDPLEPSAMPEAYRIEERAGNGAFIPIKTISGNKTSTTIKVDDSRLHSYRVIAMNRGGESFPSECLSLCIPDGADSQWVTIVNGFTRVSGPDTFEAPGFAGFYDEKDPGVPYIRDISYIGPQTEFRRDIPWMDDDAPGFGASRSTYEDRIIAGNTFDYPAIHGQAIAANCHPFISMSVDAFIADSLTCHQAIDLILGKQKTITVGRGTRGPEFTTFPEALQRRLAHAAIGQSTPIFVSGSFIASDLWDNSYATDTGRLFAQTVLGYKWRTGQATAVGKAYGVASPLGRIISFPTDFCTVLNDSIYAVESPDALIPAGDNAATIMRYSDNNIPAAVALKAPTHRAVSVGFPFEAISSEEQRNLFMRNILNFILCKQK